jgi:tRNA threonylcarbamoyladenosine biosynthesis protein TsaE
MHYKFESYSVKDTKCIAEFISKQLIDKQKPNIITLEGELGSGKTMLCKYIVQSLLGKDLNVVSPTFNILNIYENGSLQAYHYDFYRISNSQEILELGIEDAFNSLLTLIEWPQIAKEYMPSAYIKIDIQKNSNRTVDILKYG